MALVASGSSEHSESHGEDGRFLRLFVERNWHKKPEARSLAMNKWLIRGEFYDQHFEDYCCRYEQHDEQHQQVVKVDDAEAWIMDLKNIGRGRTKSKVELLEQQVRESKGDVFQLRDALLAAVRQLAPPRRTRGKTYGGAMSAKAVDQLKLKEQTRTRDIVIVCLRELLDAGIGGEVLQVCADAVHRMIQKFESQHSDLDDVSEAMAGRQWIALKATLAEIDDKIEVETGVPSKCALKRAGPETAHEGRGTRQILERCLKALGGEAHVRDMFKWIEEHPQEFEELADVHLNRKNSQSKRSKAAAKKGQAVPIWKVTVQAALNKPPFERKVRGFYQLPSHPSQDSAPSSPSKREVPTQAVAANMDIKTDAKRRRKFVEVTEATAQDLRPACGIAPPLIADPIKDAFEHELEAALGA